MLQRTHVLASEFVVGDPCVSAVVFAPADGADMPDVHVHAGEFDASDHAPTVHGLGYCVEEAVAQALVFYHVGLVLA